MSEREYRFDMGNSDTGEVGYVAYVWATSAVEAARKLQDWMPQSILAEVHDEELRINLIVYGNSAAVSDRRAVLVEEESEA